MRSLRKRAISGCGMRKYSSKRCLIGSLQRYMLQSQKAVVKRRFNLRRERKSGLHIVGDGDGLESICTQSQSLWQLCKTYAPLAYNVPDHILMEYASDECKTYTESHTQNNNMQFTCACWLSFRDNKPSIRTRRDAHGPVSS